MERDRLVATSSPLRTHGVLARPQLLDARIRALGAASRRSTRRATAWVLVTPASPAHRGQSGLRSSSSRWLPSSTSVALCLSHESAAARGDSQGSALRPLHAPSTARPSRTPPSVLATRAHDDAACPERDTGHCTRTSRSPSPVRTLFDLAGRLHPARLAPTSWMRPGATRWCPEPMPPGHLGRAIAERGRDGHPVDAGAHSSRAATDYRPRDSNARGTSSTDPAASMRHPHRSTRQVGQSDGAEPHRSGRLQRHAGFRSSLRRSTATRITAASAIRRPTGSAHLGARAGAAT